ncbi:MAG: response regulator [Candidatus Glassbacteria bacterium]
MNDKSILIVDDEKNIRLTVAAALESMECETSSAVNGEEALAILGEKAFGLILLDLKLPGMDGIEVLRKVRELRPETKVIILTAHGTVQSAVEAMKLGAADFIQKPFTSTELRELVNCVLNEKEAEQNENRSADPRARFELIKKQINEGQLEQAAYNIKTALTDFLERPEPYNLMGAMLELKNRLPDARKFYRAALDIDPSYKPAMMNLERTTSFQRRGSIMLDEPPVETDSARTHSGSHR